MVWSKHQFSAAWGLAREQHGVVERQQLFGLGLSRRAIEHRVSIGRLHPVGLGVYAVGRPELTRCGRWMAAVLSCGSAAVLSHGSAAALWGIGGHPSGLIEVSVLTASPRRRPGLRVYRRPGMLERDVTRHFGIPVTGIVRTMVDQAARLDRSALERMIGEADKWGLIGPEELRRALDIRCGERGLPLLREILDRRTFRLTESELERRLLKLVEEAGLPLPLTRQQVNGFKVDFYWPALGLVVETDGLTYHRTPAQQTRDRVRDQAHTAAGLTQLRFAHAQVCFEAEQVAATLRRVVRRLEVRRAS